MTVEGRTPTPQKLSHYWSLLSTEEGRKLSEPVKAEMLAELLSQKAQTLLKLHGAGGITPAVDVPLLTARVSLTLARGEADATVLNLAAETGGRLYETAPLYKLEGKQVVFCLGSEPWVGGMTRDVDPLLSYMATRLSQRGMQAPTRRVAGFLSSAVAWREDPAVLSWIPR